MLKVSFGSRLLEELNQHGEEARADFNDAIEPNGGYFGWQLFYQNGNLCLQVTLEDFNEVGREQTVTEQTWILTPQ